MLFKDGFYYNDDGVRYMWYGKFGSYRYVEFVFISFGGIVDCLVYIYELFVMVENIIGYVEGVVLL